MILDKESFHDDDDDAHDDGDNDDHRVFIIQVGASCLQLAIWCPFLHTIADKKCKRGDILR